MSTEQEHYGKEAEPITLLYETPKYVNQEDFKIKVPNYDKGGLTANGIFFKTNYLNEKPILMLCDNGDIFVKCKLIENDKEVVDAMREFLLSMKNK